MKSPFRFVALLCALAASPAAALTFGFENFGFAVPSDCTVPAVPQPACVVLDVVGTANDIGNAIPGNWNFTAHGQVLFGAGSGTFLFDDPSAANNDFFGTFANVLFPPDTMGIAQSLLSYTVTGGSGIFHGATGSGSSSLTVVVAPFAITPQGVPLFAAACPSVPAGPGGFCERGQFTIPEPSSFLLIALAVVAMLRVEPRRRFGAHIA